MDMPFRPEQFCQSHPWPEECGINSLFRFYKIDSDRLEYLEHFFIDRKLYHPRPSQFNDPFERALHFSLPKDAKKIHNIQQHLIELQRKRGLNEEKAKEFVSKIMIDRKRLRDILRDSTKQTFDEMRICSFTTQKDNLLFWSHYADSHKGFCVEFDATKMPISVAFKVQYKNKFPEVIYPGSNDATLFIPVLVKSEVWEYEKEFRTIFLPKEEVLENDGESLILEGDVVKNVYLGSKIDAKNKECVFDLVKRGGFNPGIWSTSLAESTFSLEFAQVVKPV